jgi:hypothetical protein
MSSRQPCQRQTLLNLIEKEKARGFQLVLEVGPQRRRENGAYGLNVYSHPPDERFDPVVHFRGWLNAATLYNVRFDELLEFMSPNLTKPESGV